MAVTSSVNAPGRTSEKRRPRLENGDRLTRAEFERRYAAMPKVNKAELIEGIVQMPSPVHLASHAHRQSILVTWLGTYEAATPGTQAADNATVRLDMDNEPQPDVLLRILPEAGGQSRTDADDYLADAPELIVEVASSSASYDLHEKKRAYRRNGVREYLVWLVDEERVEWWELVEGEYVSLPVENGLIKSHTFPGLWLNIAALVAGRSADVLARLQEGLASPGHAEFTHQLRARLAG